MFRPGCISATCFDLLRTATKLHPKRSPPSSWTIAGFSTRGVGAHVRPTGFFRPHVCIRLNSTSRPRANATQGLTVSQQTVYTRLRPVIDTFETPVDWAVAYGSGVVHQANASPGTPPLTDFLLSTPSSSDFHATNIQQNPSHYPLYARLMGGPAIGWLQDTWGAGIWYVTMVKIHDIEVKYGVISTERLKKDLAQWDTLYVAGRLHKPVLPLRTTPDLQSHIDANLRSALHLSLLLLPPNQPFSELVLWEQIAGISYSGDPRMSVPGAENPEKVKNIVRGPGVLDGFRRLYGKALRDVPGLRWDGHERERSGLEWRGQGDEMLVPDDTEYLLDLLVSLPLNLRQNVARHYRTAVDGALDKQGQELRATTGTPEKEVPEHLDFWRSVVEKERFREVVQNELKHIIRRPALTQSIKGLFTAGLLKSYLYSYAKFRKWLRGRRKA